VQLQLGPHHIDCTRRTAIMAILNVSYDSPVAPSIVDPARALDRARELHKAGAEIIDVGAHSTSSVARDITPQEEIERVAPVVEALARDGLPVSVDTWMPEVANAAAEAGAHLLNDVTGFTNPAMVAVAVERRLPVVVMHMRGEPKRHYEADQRYDDIAAEVRDFLVERADFAGTVDLTKCSGSVALTDSNEFSVDSFLRIVYSLALVEAHGLVVHAASLVRSGKAYLFCGPSGSGKTTVSRLSRDAILLSDELSIVRIYGAEALCYGTPFWGELARAGEDRAAPLVGIYFLHKAERHAVEAIGPRRALERLLPNVLFFAREADLTARVLGISADLVEAVPCFDLSFRPDPGFWEVVEDA